jgi:hypothetical protein
LDIANKQKPVLYSPSLCCKFKTLLLIKADPGSTLFVGYILLSIHSILFSPDPVPEVEDDDEDDYYNPSSSKGKERDPEQAFGMVNIPMTPGSAMFPMSPLSPMTPRTRAFTALEGAPSHAQRTPSFPPPPLSEEKKKRKFKKLKEKK